jgi:predicted nucleotidyltransferase
MNADLKAGADQNPVLLEIVRRLVECFHPDRIYLFGSRARGEAGPDSDYDLMVVVSEALEPSYRLSQRAYEMLWGTGVSKDVLVWPRRFFDERARAPSSLPAAILREGHLLYAA